VPEAALPHEVGLGVSAAPREHRQGQVAEPKRADQPQVRDEEIRAAPLLAC
jgi:hypothetical protein